MRALGVLRGGWTYISTYMEGQIPPVFFTTLHPPGPSRAAAKKRKKEKKGKKKKKRKKEEKRSEKIRIADCWIGDDEMTKSVAMVLAIYIELRCTLEGMGFM